MIDVGQILGEAGVHVLWKGDNPTDVNQITDAYIAEDIDGSGPRCEWCDGTTPITAQAIRDLVNAYVPPTQDEINDQLLDQTLLNGTVLRILIETLNDGTFVPGSNYTWAQIKNVIKTRM